MSNSNFNNKLKNIMTDLMVIITIILLWQFIAIYSQETQEYDVTLIPTLQEIIKGVKEFSIFNDNSTFSNQWFEGLQVLLTHSLATISRALGGIVIGVVLGVLLGLFISFLQFLRFLFLPTIQIIRAIPILTLIPLFLLWFGDQEYGVWIYVSFAVFVLIIINTLEAVRNVPKKYSQYAFTIGANRFQLFHTVIFPAIIPRLIGPIRVSLGASWAIVLAAEYLAVTRGLGYLMILSERFFKINRMVVIAILFVSFSMILNKVFVRIARSITHWKY
jgi:ABC-type nitrate/sulfonate/bicarbonate transport system permease component